MKKFSMDGALRRICAAALLALAPVGLPSQGAAQASCVAGAADCPIVVTLKPDGPARVLRGRLTRGRAAVGYRFSGDAGQTLVWSLSGPATHVVLTDPAGDTDGPGLPQEIKLDKPGNYVFGIASNTMAENIYGPYRLTLKLIRSK